jgi:hypothetical protein
VCALADILDNYAEACAKLATAYGTMGGNLNQPRFYPFIQKRFAPFIVQDHASTNGPDIDRSLIDEPFAHLSPLRLHVLHRHALAPAFADAGVASGSFKLVKVDPPQQVQSCLGALACDASV